MISYIPQLFFIKQTDLGDNHEYRLNEQCDLEMVSQPEEYTSNVRNKPTYALLASAHGRVSRDTYRTPQTSLEKPVESLPVHSDSNESS